MARSGWQSPASCGGPPQDLTSTRNKPGFRFNALSKKKIIRQCRTRNGVMVSIKLAKDFDSVRPGTDDGFRNANEETMLGYSRNGAEPLGQLLRAGNGAKKTIQNKMPVVGDKGLSAGQR